MSKEQTTGRVMAGKHTPDALGDFLRVMSAKEYARDLGEYKEALAWQEAKTAEIEAKLTMVVEVLRRIQKTMDGYRSQMRFCDVEAIGYFREFDRRVDASGFRAALAKLEGRS